MAVTGHQRRVAGPVRFIKSGMELRYFRWDDSSSYLPCRCTLQFTGSLGGLGTFKIFLQACRRPKMAKDTEN